MSCPRCKHQNPPDAAFCQECGARLDAACPGCGTPNPRGAKFCKHCGERLAQTDVSGRPATRRFGSPESYTPKHLADRILTSKGALEGERKQVTVLFADLKGSLELLADRDPEEARELLDPVLERMIEAVHRYEGTVNQVMGDGIMALFGAPIALEDHAVRACYAALDMQTAIRQHADELQRTRGVGAQIRVGLNSGEVVVRTIGSDLHMDYAAIGQTTHLAARMEQLAQPGTTLITPETLKLVEGYVRVRPLGAVPVKGLERPVEVYELTAAAPPRSRLHVAAARGLTRFVGRVEELERLRRALGRAATGHGQVVAVVGEPGVGKSRLVWEATHSDCTHGWLILEAAVAYGKATSYLPVIALLKGYFQIEDRDDHDQVREKVVGKLGALDRALEPLLPVFLALLDVPVDDAGWQALDPPQRRERTLEAIKRLLLRESQAQALLLVFEDLHWIDTESEALLDRLVDGLPTARLLLLVNYRPEYEHRWGSKTYYAQIRLDPLPPQNVEAMLQSMLGSAPVLEAVRRTLNARAEGNPFFLEESVRALVETGVLVGERGAYRLARPVTEIHVAPTVQAVLAARIDRLSPQDKSLLHSAAVVGKDVPVPLLEAVAGLGAEGLRAGLARLRAAEFLYEAKLFPEVEYTFKHALTHEVAYESILRDRRRLLHAALVEEMERLYPRAVAEHAERLAHHAFLGEVWDKAVAYSWQAGAKAAARSAHRDAATLLEQAITALHHLPENHETVAQAIDIRFDLRNALLPAGEFESILGHLRAAEDLARQLGDQRRLGMAAAYETDCLRLVGDSERAIESGQRALAIADACGDFSLRISTNTYLGQVYQSRGEYRRAIILFRENVDALVGSLVLERYGVLQLPSVHSRTCLTWCLAQLGEFEEGLARGEEAIRIAESVEHPLNLIVACSGLGALYFRKGDLGNAIPLLERAVEVSRTWEIPLWFPRVSSDLGLAYAVAGRGADALPLLEQAVERASTMRMRGGLSLSVAALGEGRLLAGRPEAAPECALRALALAREHGERGHEAWALRLLGEIATRSRPPDHVAAERYWGEALRLARELEMRPLAAHCLLGFGQLAVATGDRATGERRLTSALALFVEMDMPGWADKAEAELAALRGLAAT